MFGKMYNERADLIGAALVFVGFNITFFSQFIIGADGAARRYAEYDPEFQTGQIWSSIGSFILAIGLFWTLIYLVHGLLYGKKASDNPWGGVSLEWATKSPPIMHNFHDTPHVDADPYNFPEIDRSKKGAH